MKETHGFTEEGYYYSEFTVDGTVYRTVDVSVYASKDEKCEVEKERSVNEQLR